MSLVEHNEGLPATVLRRSTRGRRVDLPVAGSLDVTVERGYVECSQRPFLKVEERYLVDVAGLILLGRHASDDRLKNGTTHRLARFVDVRVAEERVGLPALRPSVKPARPDRLETHQIPGHSGLVSALTLRQER